MPKNNVQRVTPQELGIVTDVLNRLTIQGKFKHMKTPVKTVLGGLIVPQLVTQGDLSKDDPKVKKTLESYSKDKIREIMSPKPVEVEVETVVTEVVHERAVYRRLKPHGVDKQKLKERMLDCDSRDLIIRWWNVNQRLVDKNDPVTVTLTAQINALYSDGIPLAPMQLPGYFSHLCRMGMRTEEDRDRIFSKSRRRGDHTIMPQYTQAVLDSIQDNWAYQRANEAARPKDHDDLKRLRDKGIQLPYIASV